MKLSREVKIGIIVTAGIALMFWGINYLKGKDFFTSQRLVYAVYDRVDGLTASNVVLVNGMKVGLVRNLTLLPDYSGRILVSMHVSNKVNIPRNSVAEIYSMDLLGTKGIRMVFGDSKDELRDGDTLISGMQSSLSDQVSAQVLPIKQKAESLLSSMDSILLTIRGVFNESTKNNLKNSFASISVSLASIQNIAGNLDTVLAKQGRLRLIFDNLESITSNLKDNNEKIANILNNFSAISDTLARANFAATINSAQQTLEQTAVLFEKVNKGEGSLGQLAQNDSLYHNLNNTARDLDFLITDLHDNPKRYINLSLISFGGKKKDKK